ncbi:MAG TPA: PqqD family protein [Bacteroidia bacterium]|nr:PqqD family protein [Bacteroidia bacterium]
MNQRIELNKDIVIKVIEDEAVIVFVENAMIMSLNKTGTFIIEYLRKSTLPVSFDQLLKEITKEFNVLEDCASADLKDFMEKLRKNNLIYYN